MVKKADLLQTLSMINRAIGQSRCTKQNSNRGLVVEPAQVAAPTQLMKRNVARYAGFTLVEIMIVVCVIALLAAIAIPAFARYRANSRRSVCIANLRQMENAKTVWAQENRKSTTDAPVDSDLFGTDRYLRAKPACTASGVYNLGTVDTKVSCSLAQTEGHTL